MVYSVLRGDVSMDFAYKLRYLVFKEWLEGTSSVVDLCKRYGMSRKWFYKFKRRFELHGFEGLHDKARSSPIMPHALSLEKRLAILDAIYDKPVRGQKYIQGALYLKGIHVSEGAIWNFLSSEDLNTRRKRRLWAAGQGKEGVFTEKERQYMQAKLNHVESKEPGELVSIDTFTVNVKGLGKIWQYTGCDTYSSYGWAKIYRDKTADNSVDYVFNHIVRNCPEGKIKRVLTDQGTEFYCARHKGVDGYFTVALSHGDIVHTVTKAKHPWTNGYAERLNQTIWQEFWLSRLARQFNSIEELQKELDAFMTDYNFKRVHTGYKLKAEGLRFPAHAFYDIRKRQDTITTKY
jgi:transposase InsO family protein